MGPGVTRALLAVAATSCVASCTVTSTTATPPAYPASTLEWNVDRPGADYRSFELAAPSPDQCQSSCMNEPQCLAFTYVNPGVLGPNARCLLKNAVPVPVPQTCCVSGTKYAGAPPPAAQPPGPPPPASSWQGTPTTPPPPAGSRQWEPQTDRPGSDYRSFDVRESRPELCRDACWSERQCRAFTYVRPGVQGPHARCGLKTAVPPARPNDCCLSGVK